MLQAKNKMAEDIAWMRRNGASNTEIKEKLGITHADLYEIINRYGIVKKSRRWTAGEERKCETLFREGMSQKAIAFELGRSVASIRTRASKKGMVRADHGVDDLGIIDNLTLLADDQGITLDQLIKRIIRMRKYHRMYGKYVLNQGEGEGDGDD